MYTYYMTQRPPMPGAMPKDGLTDIKEYDHKHFIASIDSEAYAELLYNRKLTTKEMKDYELVPMYSLVPLTRHEAIMIVDLLTDEVMRNPSKADELHRMYARMKQITEV